MSAAVGTEVRLGPRKKDSVWARFHPMQSTWMYSPLRVNLVSREPTRTQLAAKSVFRPLAKEIDGFEWLNEWLAALFSPMRLNSQVCDPETIINTRQRDRLQRRIVKP